VIQWKWLEHKAKLTAHVANDKSKNITDNEMTEEEDKGDMLRVGKVSLVLAAEITPWKGLLLMCDPCCKIHKVSYPLIDKKTSEIKNAIDSPRRALNYDSSKLHGDGKQNKNKICCNVSSFFF